MGRHHFCPLDGIHVHLKKCKPNIWKTLNHLTWKVWACDNLPLVMQRFVWKSFDQDQTEHVTRKWFFHHNYHWNKEIKWVKWKNETRLFSIYSQTEKKRKKEWRNSKSFSQVVIFFYCFGINSQQTVKIIILLDCPLPLKAHLVVKGLDNKMV